MSLIEFKNVYKIFGKHPLKALARIKAGATKEEVLKETGNSIALNNINLAIDKGEIYVVMGLSGSGKSTLVRHINRLIDPTAGEIIVKDKNIIHFSNKMLREYRRHTVSMVFQRFGLLPHKTVFQNIEFVLMIKGISKADAKEKSNYWIEKVGLSGYSDFYPKQLSGGMQQRAGLARALAVDTEIIIMDEPFSALDPLIRGDMQSILLSLQEELHKTIVFITHDFAEAIKIGKKLTIIKDGEIEQTGTSEEIINTPVSEYIQGFVNSIGQLN